MTIRLRIRELMRSNRIANAYELAARSDGRLGERTCYRLVAADGRVANFSAATLEALCDIFSVPVGELFERVSDGRRPSRRS